MENIRVRNAFTEEYDPYVVEQTPTKGFLTFLEGGPGEIQLLRNRASGERDIGPGETLALSGFFKCEPCKFEFVHYAEEAFYVIEGEVRLELDTGEVVDLKTGDMASFGRGGKSIWTVKTPYIEFFTVFE